MKLFITPLVLLALLFPSALLAEKEVSAIIANHQVTAAEYAAFLNEGTTSNAFGSYDEKMPDIIRSGEPGDYHYDVIEGKEVSAINYVSLQNVARYSAWKEVDYRTEEAWKHDFGTDPELAASTSTLNFNSRMDPSSLAQCWPENSSWRTFCAGLLFCGMASSEVSRDNRIVEEDLQERSSSSSLARNNTLRTARPEQESRGEPGAFSNFHDVKVTLAHAKTLQDERSRLASELERVGTPSMHLGEAGRKMLCGTTRALFLSGGVAGTAWLLWNGYDFVVDIAHTLVSPFGMALSAIAILHPVSRAALARRIYDLPALLTKTREAFCTMGTLMGSQLTLAATDFREVPAAISRFWEAHSVHQNSTLPFLEARAREMKFYKDFLGYDYYTRPSSQEFKALESTASAHQGVEESFLIEKNLTRDQLTPDQTSQILTKANALAFHLLEDPSNSPETYEARRKKEAQAAYATIIRGAYFEKFLSQYKNIASTPPELLPTRLAARAHLLMEKSDKADNIYQAALEDFTTVGEKLYGEDVMSIALERHQETVSKNGVSLTRYPADQVMMTASILKKHEGYIAVIDNNNFPTLHKDYKKEALQTHKELLAKVDREASNDLADPLHETWQEARLKAFQCAGHTTIVLGEFALWFIFPDLRGYVGPQINLILNLAAPFYVEPMIARVTPYLCAARDRIHAALPTSTQDSLVRAREHFSFMDQFALPAGHEADEEASMKARALKIRSTYLEASNAISRYYQIKAAQRNLEEVP